ncbi:RdgB/HAM1 family non-canonical purine NTP pyrophosphatase [Candidatus Poriferisodalis sp.]|uniref:RdgB/HAM1 family non-canonical purine NTP pyrophosphatase n=1 Tax=Candidatus Poriferisodalis sp. TaxID=3101277 RepID=UPI003B02E277
MQALDHSGDRAQGLPHRDMGCITRLVMASANPHKAVEIAAVLREAMPEVQILPRPPELGEVVEDGATLVDNALIKARAVYAVAGEPTLADDTGLEVDTLDGAPGVYSARYAGPEADSAANVAKLMAALVQVPPPRRTARFRTVVAAALDERSELVAHGVVEGTIALAPRGHGGFGYDPVFVPDEAAPLTFAQLSREQKNRISHRARALRRLAAQLTQHCG